MNNEVLSKENILLNVGQIEKDEAINLIGEIFVSGGYTTENYVDSMFEREETLETYIGNGVAIPHGTSRSEEYIYKSGIVVLQSKEGVHYGDNVAYLIIGIAGVDGEHLDILSKIALTLGSEETVAKIVNSNSKKEIYDILINN